MAEHPLQAMMDKWLPEFDFAVLSHGFAPHGRDYLFVLQVAGDGTYELTLTHVVEVRYQTTLEADIWSRSWEDLLTDYNRWQAEGQPDGYVWGTNSSLAYPGLQMLDDDPVALRWATAVGKPMFAMRLETNQFALSLVFHGAKSRKISDRDSGISGVLNPL